MFDKQVRGRHGRAVSKLLFLSNILMYFHIEVCSVRLSVRTLAFQVGKTGSIPVPSTRIPLLLSLKWRLTSDRGPVAEDR